MWRWIKRLFLLVVLVAIVGGAGACPIGGAAMPMAGMAMAGHGSAHVEQQDAVDAAASGISAAPESHDHAGAHCDMTCPAAGCTAAGHCSATAAIADRPAASTPAAAQHRAPASVGEVPHSVSTAPEPPPPRA